MAASRSYLRLLALAAACATLTHAQPPPPSEMRASFRNLSFAEGNPGAAPPGWFLGPEWFMPPHVPVYQAETAAGAPCHSGRQCGVVRSIRDDPSMNLAFLYQVVDATPYRGKRLKFRAAVRADVAPGNAARLLVRIHRLDGGTSFRDDMGKFPVISSAWAFYEIDAPVGLDARDIELGMQLAGRGAAWIDDISIESENPEEQAIRALIRKFADARNAHNGSAVADTYSEDGEYISLWGQHVRGRAVLASIWGSAPGQAQRTIDGVEMVTPDIAAVRVSAEFSDGDIPRIAETFVAVKEDGAWKIRVHQAVDPSRR